MTEKMDKTTSQRKRSSAKKVKQQNAIIRGRTLYVRFPFNDDMEHFEEEAFTDIMMAKRFIEECEVDLASIVNGNGTVVTSYIVGDWLSYA